MAQVSINRDLDEWGLSTDSGERARLLQSPSVDIAPKSEGEAPPGGLGGGTTSTLGAIFIVVNACLGAGLLNFPAAFSTAGGVAAGITLQMVSEGGLAGRNAEWWVWAPGLRREALDQEWSVTHANHSPLCHAWLTLLNYCSILSFEAR